MSSINTIWVKFGSHCGHFPVALSRFWYQLRYRGRRPTTHTPCDKAAECPRRGQDLSELPRYPKMGTLNWERHETESIRKHQKSQPKSEENSINEGEQNINIISWASVGTSSKNCQDRWIKIDQVDSSSRLPSVSHECSCLSRFTSFYVRNSVPWSHHWSTGQVDCDSKSSVRKVKVKVTTIPISGRIVQTKSA